MRVHTRNQLYLLLGLLVVILIYVALRRSTPLPVLPLDEVIDYSGKDEPTFLDGEVQDDTELKQSTKRPPTTLQQRYLLNASGCQIPEMQAFSNNAKQYHSLPKPLICTQDVRKYRVTRDTDEKSENHVWYEWYESPPPGLQCCYRHIKRTDYDDGYGLREDCLPLHLLIAHEDARKNDPDYPAEFVYIDCYNNDDDSTPQFRDVHAFVPSKSEVEERCNKMSALREDKLSVLLIGVDSVSRLNMERHLPRTHALLASPPLSAVTLLGYNKVADNTFPNLMPALMGRSIEEVPQACDWPDKKWYNTFDSCPIIWEEYANEGYRTMYAEECPHLSTFNFQKGGFFVQPTDYYLRPLLLAAADHVGHTRAENCVLCMGARSSVKLLLNYATQFVRRFSSKDLHFAFVWATSLTHDGLNMAGLADKPFYDAITTMIEHGDLRNTALFFISDHGVRTGDFRLTPQGRMEERLPFLAVSLPQWFRKKYAFAVANLELNAAKRLTTPFDIYETLKDLLKPVQRLRADAIRTRLRKLKESKTKPRGISLFLEIPEDRTCADAGIPRHWCTCLSYKPMSLDDPRLKMAAQALVKHINEHFLKEHFNICKPLSLARIVEARIGLPSKGDNLTTMEGIKDYALTIQTTPGGALLEGAVRTYTHRGIKNRKRTRFEVADTISRLNRYGSQSDCVDDWLVKLYCFCYNG